MKRRVERIRQKRIKLNQTKGINQEPIEYYDAIRSGDYYMFETEFETSDSEKSDLDQEIVNIAKRLSEDKLVKSDSNDAPRVKDAIDQQAVELEQIVVDQNIPFKAVYREINEITNYEPTSPMISQPPLFSFDSVGLTQNEDKLDIKRESWLTIENQTALNMFNVSKKGFFVVIDFVIEYFNKHSKEFRIVSHILSNEKLVLKKEFEHPQLIVTENEKQKKPSFELLQFEENTRIINEASYEIDEIFNNLSRLDKILSSVFYLMLSQSELICYFFMILNHLTSASLLSVPLPISVFLWALLCIPRPTKTYWITIITYVEVIVVVKYIFQFNVFSWNSDDSNPSSTSLIKTLELLGIEQVKNDIQFAIYDLFVLLSIFLHRLILKKMGLWRDSSIEDDDFLASKEDQDSNKSQTNDIQNVDADESSSDNDESLFVNSNKVKNKAVQTIENDEINVFEEDFESISENDLYNERKGQFQKSGGISQFSCIKFYQELNTKCYAVVVDFYAKMFCCDFINLIITVFTYQYFGEAATNASQDSTSVVNSITANKVPYTFLIMFLIQFLLMIIDRALYLRKQKLGKFIFQTFLVIFVHVWIFFILPFITKLRFIDNSAVQIWYFVKCIYFAFSSQQIRCGYPKRILGNVYSMFC